MNRKSSRPTNPFGMLPRPVTTSETPRSKSMQGAAVSADKDDAKRSPVADDSEEFNPYQYGAIQLTGGFFNRVITTDLPEAADDALCHDTLPPGQVALRREAIEAKVSTQARSSPDASGSKVSPSEHESVELNQSPAWLRPKRGLWLLLLLGCAALIGFLALGKRIGTSPLPELVERPPERDHGVLAKKLPSDHNLPRNDSIPTESAALTQDPQPKQIGRPSPALNLITHRTPSPSVRTPAPAAAKPPISEPKSQSAHSSSADELYFDPE